VLDSTPSGALISALLADVKAVYATTTATYQQAAAAATKAQNNPDAYNYGVLAGDETPAYNM
jgi:hypothetical protein